MNIKALIIFMPFMIPSKNFQGRPLLKWTGAAARICEILKRGESQGIEYVVAFDKQCFFPAKKQYPVVFDALKNHRIYLLDLYPLWTRFIARYKSILQSAFALSRIAKDEKIDLLISPSALDWMCLETYIAAKLTGKPWTAIWQMGADPKQPRATVPLNLLNIFSYLRSKRSSNQSVIGSLAEAASLLTQFWLAEKTLMLAISRSLANQMKSLNPKANFHPLVPANGVDIENYSKDADLPVKYQAIFFGRRDPKKGLYDLPIIWKNVVQKFPEAKLAIAGITTSPKFVEVFRQQVQNNQLSENIVFLGELGRPELIRAITSSALTLYPSIDDAFSLVVLDSLACGTPVVAYNIPAIHDNFENCPAVLRCPTKDISSMIAKTESILENAVLQISLKKEAQEYAQKYTWENVVKAEKEAYIQVIARFN